MQVLSPISSPFFILSVGLTLALLTALCLAPVKANSQLGVHHLSRQLRSSDREHCTVKGACSFYSRCIESKFPCGNNSFIEAYAIERCHAIRHLRAHRVGSGARTWAQKTEKCFQQKLLDSYPVDSHPDPQTCLAWEHNATGLLTSCYEDLKTELLSLPSKDVHKMIDIFRLGGHFYNTTTVDNGLVKVYAGENKTKLDSLQSDYTNSTKQRALLCVEGEKFFNLNPEEFVPSPENLISAVVETMNIENVEDVHYVGPDDDELCINRENDHNAHKTDYFILAWFKDSHQEGDMVLETIKYNGGTFHVFGGVYELSTANPTSPNDLPRLRTRCGDGVRQILEECDVADNYPACTLDCRVEDVYDCTVKQLEPSQCWVQECGDGLRTRGEECDDSNTKDGDGCSSNCTLEYTHTCTDTYNTTSKCTPLPVAAQKRPAPAKLLLAVSGEAMKRTVAAASSSNTLSYSLLWTLVLLLVSFVSLR